jgi:predicted esterase
MLEEKTEYKYNTHLIDYVKERYEHTLHDVSYLVYPAQKPTQLWVLFNGATASKYTMWSWFWRPDEDWDDVAYLFLKDDDIRWYLGSTKEPKTEVYMDIICSVMRSLQLQPEQVCMIGHSMGGYAALYYGLLLSVGCVYVFRPQVTWEAAVTYYSIKKLHEVWKDIDQLVSQVERIPPLYIQYGEFEPDKRAGHALIDVYKERYGIMIVEHTEHQEHIGYHPTQQEIEKTIEYLVQ